jgi:glycosyltransferase involved in cell wall biosynthesis
MTPETDRPLVSVVIPCFNQARFLPAAIRSVRIQKWQPVETIVVDDGSEDDTSTVAGRMGARVIVQPNRGVSEARNVGLAAAGGSLIVFLDADDELLPDALETGVDALRAQPDVSAAVGRCELMDADGRLLPVQHHDIDPTNLYREWLTKNFVWTPGAAMFRREALARHGGFPADLGPAADYSVYLRLARLCQVVYHGRYLVRYRQHDRNMSRDAALMLETTLEALGRERRSAPPSCGAAITDAERAWRNWYGEQLIEGLSRDLRSGYRSGTQLRAAWTLMRHCPAVVWRRVVSVVQRRFASIAGA